MSALFTVHSPAGLRGCGNTGVLQLPAASLATAQYGCERKGSQRRVLQSRLRAFRSMGALGDDPIYSQILGKRINLELIRDMK